MEENVGKIPLFTWYYKKGDPLNCTNFRAITLLNAAYKICHIVWTPETHRQQPDWPLSVWFQARKVHSRSSFHTPADPGQKPRKSKSILPIFLSILRPHITAFIETSYAEPCLVLAFPEKLVRLCRMTMENARCSIKVGNDLTGTFDVKKGFRQGDALSCDFNWVVRLYPERLRRLYTRPWSSQSCFTVLKNGLCRKRMKISLVVSREKFFVRYSVPLALTEEKIQRRNLWAVQRHRPGQKTAHQSPKVVRTCRANGH